MAIGVCIPTRVILVASREKSKKPLPSAVNPIEIKASTLDCPDGHSSYQLLASLPSSGNILLHSTLTSAYMDCCRHCRGPRQLSHCSTCARWPLYVSLYACSRRRKLGPPHKMTMAARNALAELVRQKPSLHRYEMAEFI